MMMYRRGSAFVCLLVLTALFFAACTPRLIAPYDQTTDMAVTALQRELSSFFVEQQRTDSPVCDYNNYVGFYDTLDVDLSSLIIRNEAREQNRLTVEQLQLLGDSFGNLERLHELSSCLPDEQIEVLRQQFDASFAAILRLELAKRR